MGFVADILGFGQSAGPHFKFDYSTATGAGISTLTQAQLASSTGVSSILYASADGASVVVRSDVDVDPIATNGYPRSEWREEATNGTSDRAFNPTTGDHMIEPLLLPMHLPPIKPAVVICQIHDDVQDLLEIVVQPRSDYATTGKLEVALKVAHGGTSSSSGIPRFIADFGTLAELLTKPKWLNPKIRCGLIGPGGTAGWTASCNGTTINSWDSGIPSWDGQNAATAYYKTGVYLQTKWTGSAGGNGLETDRNEYGELAWRSIKVTHNGEATPYIPVTGSRVEDTVSGVAFGALATVTKPSGTPSASITPAFPTAGNAPVVGELVFALTETRRSSSSVAATCTNSDSAWYNAGNVATPGATATPATGGLQANTIRYQLWVARYTAGMAAPTFTQTSGTSEILKGIVGRCVGAKAGVDSLSQQTAMGVSVATPQTTTLGPAPAMSAAVDPGSLIIARCSHEYSKASGTLPTITGDSLTWTEALENITDWCFVMDYLINAASVTPGSKTVATTTIATAGRGCGQQLAIGRAKRHRHSNRVCASVG